MSPRGPRDRVALCRQVQTPCHACGCFSHRAGRADAALLPGGGWWPPFGALRCCAHARSGRASGWGWVARRGRRARFWGRPDSSRSRRLGWVGPELLGASSHFSPSCPLWEDASPRTVLRASRVPSLLLPSSVALCLGKALVLFSALAGGLAGTQPMALALTLTLLACPHLGAPTGTLRTLSQLQPARGRQPCLSRSVPIAPSPSARRSPAPFCCSLRPLDIEFMKRLSKVVNIVPVIAKADTLTLEERVYFKQRVGLSTSVRPPPPAGTRLVRGHQTQRAGFPQVEEEAQRGWSPLRGQGASSSFLPRSHVRPPPTQEGAPGAAAS